MTGSGLLLRLNHLANGFTSAYDARSLLLPLTWAASTVDPQDRNRLQNLLRKLQPHYLVDPKLMQSVIDIDWTQMMDLEVEDWCRFMREKGFYVPFF